MAKLSTSSVPPVGDTPVAPEAPLDDPPALLPEVPPLVAVPSEPVDPVELVTPPPVEPKLGGGTSAFGTHTDTTWPCWVFALIQVVPAAQVAVVQSGAQ
jgi:hypothetical protein